LRNPKVKTEKLEQPLRNNFSTPPKLRQKGKSARNSREIMQESLKTPFWRQAEEARPPIKTRRRGKIEDGKVGGEREEREGRDGKSGGMC